MTTTPLHRIGTIGAVLALGALGGCASLWAPKHQAAASSVAAQQTVSPGLVKQVQAKLQDAGYYKGGNVDGVWGDATRRAVERYQTDHNLRPSGQLDAPTLQAMNIPSTSPDNQAADQNPPVPPANPPPPMTNPPSTSTSTNPAYTAPNPNR